VLVLFDFKKEELRARDGRSSGMPSIGGNQCGTSLGGGATRSGGGKDREKTFSTALVLFRKKKKKAREESSKESLMVTGDHASGRRPVTIKKGTEPWETLIVPRGK